MTAMQENQGATMDCNARDALTDAQGRPQEGEVTGGEGFATRVNLLAAGRTQLEMSHRRVRAASRRVFGQAARSVETPRQDRQR
ncbi:hypothetical protein J1614_002402 [Plenodomus biglobosus]|nr:hypothetical protein J1614_002402 [Plenodomus biglobosus]